MRMNEAKLGLKFTDELKFIVLLKKTWKLHGICGMWCCIVTLVKPARTTNRELPPKTERRHIHVTITPFFSAAQICVCARRSCTLINDHFERNSLLHLTCRNTDALLQLWHIKNTNYLLFKSMTWLMAILRRRFSHLFDFVCTERSKMI